MAQIVGGFGVPHTPIFPHFVKRDGPDCEIARLFGAQKEQLAATRPDVIVMFDTDHLNTFFLDSLPIFALGVDKTFKAPNDEPRDVPNYVVPSAPDLAAHIRQAGIEAGFDVGMTQNFSVDHSVTVPLHFLTPNMNIPVVPFFISGHVPPLPSSRRCFALGQAVGRAIATWPENKRVVVMGSGSFSLEVGGPRMAPGRTDGVPDPEWCSPRHQASGRPADRHVDQGIDAAPDAEGRQRRRRAVELDRYAGRHRQPQTELRRAADAERPRLRRVALELGGCEKEQQ